VLAEIYGINGRRYEYTDFGKLKQGRHDYISDTHCFSIKLNRFYLSNIGFLWGNFIIINQ